MLTTLRLRRRTAFRLAVIGATALVAPAAADTSCQPAAADAPAFPLRVAAGGRYLADSAGKPFFIHGDSPWSLIAQLTREQAELYLQDRRKRGFNTLLVNLLEHRFSTNAPANIHGDAPFLGYGDYTASNEAYFRNADWILRRSCELGFLVLLAPSYAGNGGGEEGWYQEMVAAGPDALRRYGRFLGERYKGLDNIVWVEGGDYNPPQKELVDALVAGIAEKQPAALHTAHGSPGSSPADYWAGERWLALNNVYTYDPVYAPALEQFAKQPVMPFFLMESSYENEHGAGAADIRLQAYQAILSGAAGHLYGNNPIWHFDGPGLFDAPDAWQQALDSPGARSMEVLKRLVDARRWWLLEPDAANDFLVEGRGDPDRRAVAAVASDGSFGLVYVPTRRTVTVDLGRLSGGPVQARWIDPSTGAEHPADGSPFRSAEVTLAVPKGNGEGSADWLLELISKPQADQSQ